MSTVISGSSNVSVLDQHTVADLCLGKFFIDVTPSVYIDNGADLVLGAKVQIKNPAGIVIKAYGGYDLSPAFSGGMDEVVEFSIPTQAGNFQYGKYTVEVTMVDADGTVLTADVKTVYICEPDTNNKTRKYGTLGASIKGVCKEGKVYVSIDNIPNYRGKIFEDSTNTITMEYPTGSGLPVISTSLLTFSVQLFEGDYLLTGTICASYNFGDNVYVNVPYKIKVRKPVKCIIDECCVASQLQALQLKIDGGCSLVEKEDAQNKIINALKYLKLAQLLADCGDDPSDYISALEDTLDCICTCNCNEGVPIINNSPSKDFIIEGCNVTKTTVGLTDHYTIENYEYKVASDPAQSVITVTAPSLADCKKTQTISFNAAAAYQQIKNQISGINEFNFWANIVNLPLNTLDATCLGYTASEWAALSWTEKFAAIIAKACDGGSCTSSVSSGTVTQVGSAAKIDWASSGAYTVDVFVDGILRGTVLGAVTTFTVPDMADAESHDYVLIPKCGNGSVGTPFTGTFGFLNCPSIAAPNVSSNNVNGAACPFNLNSIVSAPMSGIFHEWHTANNTLSSSLVPNPAAVSSGVYYVFAFDTDGCYSLATQVTVICASATSCTAPQTLLVVAGIGGNHISFQTAAFPPPANSYTVKRKAGAAPDVDGSYTTIGTPTWNSSTNRWEIVDATAVVNTLYTYKAISNCADASRPATTYNYANLTCPTLTLTHTSSTIGYSFTGVGGGVDKYEVKLYDATGTILEHTDTQLPAFASPITGTFIYLDAGTGYKVRIRVWIGATYKDCDFVSATTDTSSGGAMTVFLTKTGTFSGTLSFTIDGGTAPYSYIFSCTGIGPCEAHTIDAPTGTLGGIGPATSPYSCTAYAGTTYQFVVQVTDNLGNIVTSNVVSTLPCLVPETMILMNGGTRERQLGTLKIGDLLDGKNSVISFERRTVNRLYDINNGLLRASEGHVHIIRTPDGDKTVQSAHLEEGNYLIDRYDEVVQITSIAIHENAEFEVIDISTKTQEYVANGIRTHNKIACP